ncbi:hypothetical protein [uncultured Dokdonia sp.]|uniref:hypothetical protein n=1 Tax=Dokdonia sp. R78006 TaxID=3093866 RepID=UPI0026138194|nr:hypothetical protein [uncultured Dokdonia sp.]
MQIKSLILKKTQHFHTGHRATGEEIVSDIHIGESLNLGGLVLDNEKFAIYDFEFPLDGLISLTPFLLNQITIDFKNKRLTIESSTSLQVRVDNQDFEMPLLIHNDKDITIGIATHVLINDKLSLLVNIDSGAGFNVYRFNSRYIDTLGLVADNLKSEYKNSSFKPESGNTFYYATLDSLSNIAKNTSVNDIKVSFVEGLIYEGIMGVNWLGEIITIDMKNKKFIVQK